MRPARVVLSGIQPTGGVPHLGNYLGAIKQWSRLSRGEGGVSSSSSSSERLLFSIVDLHALTVPMEGSNVHANSLDMACSLLGCGLDVSRSEVSLFRQSFVMQHCELMWILACVTQIAWMNHMTQFKEKKGTTMGLFTYPILMAADILLYRASHVPVGDDQHQHLELAREIANKYNLVHKVQRFKKPITMGSDKGRVLSLRDPTQKMSKSDPLDSSRINMTDSADVIAKKIRKAVTDSEPFSIIGLDERPGVKSLVDIAATLQDTSVKDVSSKLEGRPLSELKELVTQITIEKVVPIGKEIARYKSDLPHVEKILSEGAKVASSFAEETMKLVRADVTLTS